MDRKKKIADLVIEQGVLPLYFHSDASVSAQILRTLYNAGCRVIEYTNRGSAALDNFLQLRKIVDKELPGLYLGAGTIRNKIEATEFINEGAAFIVCPGVDKGVADLCDDNDLLWVPGCLTATEIMEADKLGAVLIKLFPGGLLGPAYANALQEIFPDLLFIAIGNIETTEDSLTAWFNNGICAVGLGNELISKDLADTKDYAALESLTRHTLQTVKKVRAF